MVRGKIRVLIITQSTLLCHLFNIISDYFNDYKFVVSDSPDMAYMMYIEGNFDLVVVSPYNDLGYELENDTLSLINQINEDGNTKIVYLGHCEAPSNIVKFFCDEVIYPFDKQFFEKALDRASAGLAGRGIAFAESMD